MVLTSVRWPAAEAARLAAIDHTAVSSTEHRHRVASGLASGIGSFAGS